MSNTKNNLAWLMFQDLGEGYFTQEVLLKLDGSSKKTTPFFSPDVEYDDDTFYTTSPEDLFKFYPFISDNDILDIYEVLSDEVFKLEFTMGAFTLNKEGKLTKVSSNPSDFTLLSDVTDIMPYLKANKNDIIKCKCDTSVITSSTFHDKTILYSSSIDKDNLDDYYVVKFLYDSNENSLKIGSCLGLLDNQPIDMDNVEFSSLINELKSDWSLQFLAVYAVYQTVYDNDEINELKDFDSIQHIQSLDKLSDKEISNLGLEISNELIEKGYKDSDALVSANPLDEFKLGHAEVELLFLDYLNDLQKL